jgi:anhydro-N-acetylmuramic acid kinase
MRAIGTMSGTSMDGVDVALVETDGSDLAVGVPGAHLTLDYTPQERAVLFQAVETALAIDAREAVDHPHLQAAADLSAKRHAEALVALQNKLDTPVDVIGYHGQTVLHRPNPANPTEAFTLQLGDAQALADATGVPVVYDFRSADLDAGGQGAPLAPLYHQAVVASRADLPAAILNLGGIANITLIQDRDPDNLLAADVGPANVFMDDLMLQREGIAFDNDGRLAALGTPDLESVKAFFADPFFRQEGPKSLDRYSFSAPDLSHLTTTDAMATLAQLTIRSVVSAVADLPETPNVLFVAGGGVRNSFIMRELARQLPCSIAPLDTLGASAAMLEAEAFAYLAVRHMRGLPTSYPATTGVSAPTVGGKIIHPQSPL